MMNKNNINKSATSIFLLSFSTTIFFGCQNTTDNKSNYQIKAIPDTTVLLKVSSSFNDTLRITSPSAVFYNPDSLQIEKFRSSTTSIIFESTMHDCFYQMRNARMILKKYWPLIRIVETSKSRYLLFVKADKSKTCIDLNTKGDLCGIFIFDSKKDPELIDMMNIDTAMGFYFKK